MTWLDMFVCMNDDDDTPLQYRKNKGKNNNGAGIDEEVSRKNDSMDHKSIKINKRQQNRQLDPSSMSKKYE